MVFRHYPVLGANSVKAAAAAEVAADKGVFWPYHDRLFSILARDGRLSGDDEQLKSIAEALGLDPEAFVSEMNGPDIQERVRAQRDEGQRRGVRATPTVFINDRKVEGLASYAQYRTIIDDLLRGAR